MLRRSGSGRLNERRILELLSAQTLLALTALVSLHNADFAAPVWREFLKAVQYGVTGALAFVAVRADDSEDRENWIRIALLSVVTLVSLVALLQERIGAPMGVFIGGHAFSRIGGPLEGPNQLGAFLGIAVPPIFVFALTRRRPQIDLAVVGLACVTTLLTFSRGGVVSLAIALLLVYLTVRGYQSKRVAYYAFAGVFTVAFVVACLQFAGIGSPMLGRVAFGAPAGSENFNGGLGTRAQLWHGAYVLWRSHPWTGIGAGNYELRVAQTGAVGVRTHANSAYFQTLAEEGLVGLLALVILAATSLRVFAGQSSALGIAMLAVVAALWFHQITDYVTFYPKVGILFWAMLGITVGLTQERLSSTYVNESATR
ncbi:MAG: O-antigen ligase family protein [Candidatus Eremiobacteraeota bacterium]|nr:O-antigen ligase family protein [Candidatus Eremiobacteraeota bacterium]